MIKKTVSIFITLALLISSAETVLGAKSDIAGHWAEKSFSRLSEMNVINGYEDGTYRPDAKITRAEFFKIINTVANVSRNSGSVFSDVFDSDWYKNTVDKAFTSKYASGYEDGTFKPKANITRAEAAAAICKAFGGDTGEDRSFSDNDQIPSWAKLYVDILSSTGILSGYEDNTFRPLQNITRAETVTMFDRFAGALYQKAADTADAVYDSTVIIGVSDVTFRNVTFEKDIYIAPGAAGGEVRFINCQMNGNIYIAARNNAGVVFEDTDAGKVCVNSSDPVKLVLTGTSVIDNVVLRSMCSLMEMNTDNGAKTVTVYANAELSGTFDEVIVAGGSGISLESGEIGKLTITADSSPQIDAKGKIKSVEAKTGGTVNGRKLSAGTKTDEVGEKNSNVKYSYTLSLANGEISEPDSSSGGARTDIADEKDAVLDDLTVNAGSLSPGFSPGVKEYSLFVPDSAGSIVIKPVVSGFLEVKVRDKAVGENGYTVSETAGESLKIDFEVFSELVLKNTYTVNIERYGLDNAGLSNITASLPYETTKTGDRKFTVKLKDGIDYSSGKIPVTIGAVPINPNSRIEIDGEAVKSKEFDLYENRQITVNVTVISENGNNAITYEVSLERDKIPAIDSADSASVNAMISSPDSMTGELLEKAKIAGAKEEKLDKYKSYLKKLIYHADGADDDEKQQLIQKAVDVVNEYDGKIIRIEAEDHYNGAANQIKPFKDEDGKAVNVTENISTDIILPEGQFEMRMRSVAVMGARQCEVMLNDTKVFSQKNESVIYVMTNLMANKFVILKQNVDVSEGNNTLTINRCDNMLCDYVELEMLF